MVNILRKKNILDLLVQMIWLEHAQNLDKISLSQRQHWVEAFVNKKMSSASKEQVWNMNLSVKSKKEQFYDIKSPLQT